MRTVIPALGKGLLLSWLLLLALPAAAATVSKLYEAEVPVTAEDTASRNQAIGEALNQVLVKLTGRDPAPGAAQLTAQAARYVQQYRYLRNLTPEGQTRTSLWVRFDKTGLDRAMLDRGLPIWGNSRPGILVWLAAQRQGRRELIGADGQLAHLLRAAAASRGLPLQWPLLDLEDQARLTTADLWSDYGSAVVQASQRYAQPLVLTGRLRQVAPDHWDGQWTLYEGDHGQALTSAGADANTAIRSAIDQLSELLAARYAPAGGDNGLTLVHLKILGVRDLDDYAAVLKLVGEREVVNRVALRSADGDALVLDVQARGGRNALAQVLDLVRSLQREPDPLPPVPIQPQPQPRPQAEAELPASAGPAPVVAAPGAAAPPAQPGEPGAVATPAQPHQASAQPTPPVAQPPQAVDLVYRLSR
jgi:hypothetical protein